MKETFDALLVQDGTITPIDLRADGHGATHTHELIGNTTCQCFRVRVGHERTIVGYCDDTFLSKNLPINVGLSGDLYGNPGYPICGPIVITANYGPDTVDMTDAERSAFSVDQMRLLRFTGSRR